MRTLRSEGLLNQELFYVDRELVEKYNRALSKITGKETALRSFHVDKRGESPELEEELGKNYLQMSPSHRHMIIVSPSQKDAGLIHEEFSFDNPVMDTLYANFFSAITTATKVDGLCGELDDGIRMYDSIEDMLSLKKIHVELHTPSGFLRKARKLQEYIDELKQNPKLLYINDSEHVKKLSDLIKEVGDIRGYNLPEIVSEKEINSFYTRLFGGVFVFRPNEPEDTMGIKRPDTDIDKLFSNQFDINSAFLDELLAGNNPEMFENVMQRKYVRKNARQERAVVIYVDGSQQPYEGPNVEFMHIGNDRGVVNFLVENGYASYSKELIEPRLDRLEDSVLLDLGYDVSNIRERERIRLIDEHAGTHMRECWHRLRELKKRMQVGNGFEDLMEYTTENVKKMLLVPTHASGTMHNMVEGLLARLWPYDYERMYDHSPRDLEHAFNGSETNIQDYMIKKITEYKRNTEKR